MYLRSLEGKVEMLFDEDSYKIVLKAKQQLNNRKINKFNYIEEIIFKYNLLDDNERKIFYYTYIESHKKSNVDIAIICGYTESHYYRLKNNVNNKMAILLDLEIYEKEKDIADFTKGGC